MPLIAFKYQALSYRRFQLVFHRVNLNRLTMVLAPAMYRV